MLFGSSHREERDGRARSTCGGEGACIQGFGGETCGEETTLKTQHRWENNIKMDLQEEGWEHGLDLSGPEYGQVAGICKRGNELSGSIKCGEFFD